MKLFLKPLVPPMEPIEGKEVPGVIDSTAALSLGNRAKSLAIIGRGVIGVASICFRGC